MSNLYLEELPEFLSTIDRVVGPGGYVDLSNNNLKNLKNCPQYIDGAFYCVESNLLSLEGGPRIVKGFYGVENNKLSNLIGSPDEAYELLVSGNPSLTTLEGCTQSLVSFNASYCNLKNLIGGPTTILPNTIAGSVSYYKVDSNPNLTSLQGAPTKVPRSFSATSCGLENLVGAPEYVGGHFIVSFNPLKSLEGCPKRVEKDFFCKPPSSDIKEWFTEEQIRSVCDVGGHVFVK